MLALRKPASKESGLAVDQGPWSWVLGVRADVLVLLWITWVAVKDHNVIFHIMGM